MQEAPKALLPEQLGPYADLVLDSPEPSVAFDGFGASSLDLLARPWALPDDFPAMQHNVRIRIYEELEAAGFVTRHGLTIRGI